MKKRHQPVAFFFEGGLGFPRVSELARARVLGNRAHRPKTVEMTVA